MLATSGLSWDYVAISHHELLTLRIDEQLGQPSYFEAVLHDPQLELWAASEQAIGTQFTYTGQAGLPYRGRVWGRDLLDAAGSPRVRFWGADDSYRLHVCREYRSYQGSLSSCLNRLASAASLQVKTGAQPSRYTQADTVFVQYDETAWEFLERLAQLSGQHLWAYRGVLHLEVNPGDGSPKKIDIASTALAGSVLELNERWCDRPAAYSFSVYGLPDKDGPKLAASKMKEATSPIRDFPPLQQLAPVGAEHASPGVPLQEGDKSTLAKCLAARAECLGRSGSLQLQGIHDFQPGQLVNLVKGPKPLLSKVLISSVSTLIEGSAHSQRLYFGEVEQGRHHAVDLRPAHHLWPAVVTGAYQPERARVGVTLLGWHPESVELLARLPGWATEKSISALRLPQKQELVLVGFEGGRPEAPVILCGLHDGKAPDLKPGEFVIQPASGKVSCTLENGKIRLETTDVDLTWRSKGPKVNIKANIDFDKP